MLFETNEISETENFLKTVLTRYNEVPLRYYEFAVELGGKVIGGVSIHLNEDLLSGEMGWICNPLYWNKGYISEAAIALKEYALNTLKLNYICAHCDSRNDASRRIM